MNHARLADELIRDEGLELKPYPDTRGKLTIGIGRNLTDKGITRAEALFLYGNDVMEVEAALDQALPWWRDLSEVRQRVLANMCFNMGIGNATKGLLSFRNTLVAMQEGRYEDAADGILNSKLARQTGARAERLAFMMRHDRPPGAPGKP